MFRKYYGSAGVSMHWLKSIAPMIKGADLWQTGGDLIDAKTGIIMHALGDTIERATAGTRVAIRPDAGGMHWMESQMGNGVVSGAGTAPYRVSAAASSRSSSASAA